MSDVIDTEIDEASLPTFDADIMAEAVGLRSRIKGQIFLPHQKHDQKHNKEHAVQKDDDDDAGEVEWVDADQPISVPQPRLVPMPMPTPTSLSMRVLEAARAESTREHISKKETQGRQTLDVVVAHYEESLDWLSASQGCVRRWIIYHKGDKNKTLADYLRNNESNHAEWTKRVQWILRDNVGRDGETVLYHCLQLKRGAIDGASPDDYTLFVQGDMRDHGPMMHPPPLWHRYIEQDYVAVWGEWYSRPGPIEHNDRYRAELQDGRMLPTKLGFADYYTLVTGRRFPPTGRVFVSYCNVFAIRNKRALAHSEQLYERAIHTFANHANPAVGHYAERLMRPLFGGSTPHCPLPFVPITH